MLFVHTLFQDVVEVLRVRTEVFFIYVELVLLLTDDDSDDLGSETDIVSN